MFILMVCSLLQVISQSPQGIAKMVDSQQGKHVRPSPLFAHIQIAHRNNIIYLSPEDKRKDWLYWLYATILTLGFRIYAFRGFRVEDFRVSGFRVFGFIVFETWKSASPTQGFEHVKDMPYAGSVTDKRQGCSGHVQWPTRCWLVLLLNFDEFCSGQPWLDIPCNTTTNDFR